MSFKIPFFGIAVLVLFGCGSATEETTNEVKIIGQMKDVMWKGQLHGTIQLDTIATKKHLFGLGPVAHLSGEIIIVDGKAYKSTVLTDSTMTVEATYAVEAPFFGYAHIPKWNKANLPDSVQTMQQLEVYLDKITKNSPRPFMFKLFGTVETAKIHIVNLPKGAKVSSPDEAHQGLVHYSVNNESSEIIGFFSTEHQTIFTHHDTYLHMHLLTADKQKMGHLDDVVFKKGAMELYLPKE